MSTLGGLTSPLSDGPPGASLEIVSVSHSRDYLEGLMQNVERSAGAIASQSGAEIVDSFLDFL